MKELSICILVLGSMCVTRQLKAQDNPSATGSDASLQITSRAVVVDLVVTDHKGVPVRGLKQSDFIVLEQGKPQTVSFFEEHSVSSKAEPAEFPTLPPNVFSNFSPTGQPPAVNVLLLDSLNSPMEDQVFVHQQAIRFLKTLEPGSRMAIFTMSMGLHFVQGFTDDPAVLVAALGNKKNNEIESPALLTSPAESSAQQAVIGQMSQIIPGSGGGHVPDSPSASPIMIAALQGFMAEISTAQQSDRDHRTLANLQQLAAFLGGFPGRKNLIWFSESFPPNLFGPTSTRFEGDVAKTVNLLTAARVAIYPVYARGLSEMQAFTASGTNASPGTQLPREMSGASGLISTKPGEQLDSSTQAGANMDPATDGPLGPNGPISNPLTTEKSTRNSDQATMDMLAHDSGGRAFYNTNGLSEVIANIVSMSGDFYTLSYTPTDEKMDGAYRRIEAKVAGGKYTLSYRRGYYATDADLPGAAQSAKDASSKTAVDPLRPFMDLGMPQSEQILYKVLIQPLPQQQEPAQTEDKSSVPKGHPRRYSVAFAIDLKDLDLKQDAEGLHKGALNISLIIYDRYGHIASRKDHQVALSIKPETYSEYEQTGVKLRAEIEVPYGQHWLRTGVYDQSSRKAGTMELPLSSVTELEAVTK
ncbi:MAG: VWA domain-containing protein [Terracidiphilus sp.]